MPTRKSSTRAKKSLTELSEADATAQLDSFLTKYSPEIETFARRTLAKMRKLVPGAIEMVYDNFNWLVIGFGPSERPSEAIFSIVLPPNAVTLCFLQGAGLPDPAGLLLGSGNVVRNLRLYSSGAKDAKVLDEAEVLSLINVALNRAKVPMPAGARRKLIIRAVAAKDPNGPRLVHRPCESRTDPYARHPRRGARVRDRRPNGTVCFHWI